MYICVYRLRVQTQSVDSEFCEIIGYHIIAPIKRTVKWLIDLIYFVDEDYELPGLVMMHFLLTK